ncbi:ATP-binding protein [Herbaspirillum huttiense]|uniref:ATP-binding protein n=1 Tax=Herbaspirillum huttiense TaxID=863372 RepID=UPI002176F059|nr:ATP-binding protein [Herbaspirillum huttiense]UWE18895.1 ATP-binding protein [Herbaspirillum huttiense]
MSAAAPSVRYHERNVNNAAVSIPRGKNFSHLRDHPLFTGELLLPTKPVEYLYQQVTRAILLSETGICFSAPSGAGKSSALDVVEGNLATDFPNIPVYVHSTHTAPISSIRAFFKHFLETVGHSKLNGETPDLRRRLIMKIVDDARAGGERTVLLFVDEAQAMHIMDFNFLKDVHNDLRSEGINLVTVLMGQEPETTAILNSFKSEGRSDLTGRFAMRALPYRALNSDDLQALFKLIDTTITAEDEVTTWTRHFFDELWKQGWRFENQFIPFINTLKEVSNFSSNAEIACPARQTFLAIRYFILERYVSNDLTHVPLDAWDAAIKYARMREASELSASQSRTADPATKVIL